MERLASEVAPGNAPPRCPPARTPEQRRRASETCAAQVLWPTAQRRGLNRQPAGAMVYYRSAFSQTPRVFLRKKEIRLLAAPVGASFATYSHEGIAICLRVCNNAS